MKKIFLFLICAFLVLGCSKKTTAPSNEDLVKLEITVNSNGQPASTIYVQVHAMVKLNHLNQNSVTGDVETVALVETQVDEELTNTYGKVNFNYRDQSLPDEKGIIIKKVVLSRLSEVILEDTEEKFIKKNEDLKLTYDVE
ncbi:hypothetical protein ACFL4T_01845 [candidate division KSB1 bacterium]